MCCAPGRLLQELVDIGKPPRPTHFNAPDGATRAMESEVSTPLRSFVVTKVRIVALQPVKPRASPALEDRISSGWYRISPRFSTRLCAGKGPRVRIDIEHKQGPGILRVDPCYLQSRRIGVIERIIPDVCIYNALLLSKSLPFSKESQYRE